MTTMASTRPAVSSEDMEMDSTSSTIEMESVSSEEDNCRKKRCSDRYDSSESSDSGVAVHCGDFGSSNSDITEPCSPLSTTSLEEMPPTQSQSQSWPWSEGSETSSRAPKRRKQGKITEFFKIKSKTFLGTQKAKPLSDYKDKSGISHLVGPMDDCLPSPPPPCEPPEPDLFETPPPSREEDPAPCHDSCEDSSTATSLFKFDDDDEEQSADVTPLFGRSSASSSSSSIKEEERTIRFPVKNGWNGHYVSDVVCRWMGCESKFNTSTALLEHLQKIHVDGQTLEEYFYCRWKDCKVFDRKSCSRSWLGRHVLSHGGNKRFACIVEGCGQRFNSQVLLTRHVNGHFVDKETKQDSKKGCEANNKLIRRNGKKLRYRREPFSARTQDYLDTGIMEGVKYNLMKVTEKRTLGLFDQVSPDSLVLRSEIIAKRTDPKGISEVLVRWFPKNILEDEWMDPTKVERTRTVKITSLNSESKDCLYEYLWSHQNVNRTPRSRKQGVLRT